MQHHVFHGRFLGRNFLGRNKLTRGRRVANGFEWRSSAAYLLGLAFLLIGVPAARGQGGPDTANGRFALSPLGEGFVRLDTRTGQVSTCAKQAAGWSCYTVPDERAALEAEIARLQAENGRLKKDLLGRGMGLPGTSKDRVPAEAAPTAGPNKSAPSASADDKASANNADKDKAAGARVPDDAEVNRVMAFMEKVWRRLIDMVARVNEETSRPRG